MCDIRLFGTVNDSIVDGPGIRFGIFVQGCPHNCPGCHNPGSHALDGGYMEKTDTILNQIAKNPLLDGVTFSGGEPFLQAKTLACMGKHIHDMGLNIITYTGYTFEELILGANAENGWRELLEVTDILIDGRFEQSKQSYELMFKGSANQRIIDVKKSIANNEIVLYDI